MEGGAGIVYVEPEMKIIMLQEEEVIRTSLGNGDYHIDGESDLEDGNTSSGAGKW